MKMQRLFNVFFAGCVCLILLGSKCYSEEGLVAYWNMDEGKGTVLRDISGNGNDGNIIDAVWVNGKYGGGLEFNGSSSWVAFRDAAILDIADEISVEAWVKPYSREGGAILGKYDGRGGYLLLASWFDTFPYFFAGKDPKFAVLRDDPLRLNEWHHIIATAKKGASANLYIDGTLKRQQKVMEHGFENKAIKFVIGKYGSRCYFKGILDEIRVYNRALSEDEVRRKFGEKDRHSVLSQAIVRVRHDTQIADWSGKDNLKSIVKGNLTRASKAIEGKESLQSGAEFKEMSAAISQIDNILAGLRQGSIKTDECLVYVIDRPITEDMVLPYYPYTGTISDVVSLVACPGEYEPGSFVVTALSDIPALKLDISDLHLQENKGKISSSNIDIKLVKCWYQGASAWKDILFSANDEKKLVPELLLNDDKLVRVDSQSKRNYLRVKKNDQKSEYISIDEPYVKGASRAPQIIPLENCYVEDSKKLLPVDISAGSNKQFWITLHVPDNTGPGIYTGKIILSSLGKPLQSVALKVKVLPFNLLPPYYTSSIYYLGKLDPSGKGSISSELKNQIQFENEMKNLRTHGIDNPIMYQSFDNKELLGKALEIRKKIGMSNRELYYLGWLTGVPNADEARELMQFVKSYGVEEVYFYGKDEAVGEKLLVQRASWEAIRKAGGKIFVAGSSAGKNYELVGDLQDILICAGSPSKIEVEKWHSAGRKIWCYANPQGGVENPLIYRMNYGLLLWKYDYDGAATYAYHASFGNIWNDFDFSTYRDHNFTYPTIDGVIDTIAWEGYREGVDDVRYITTLMQAIKEAKSAKDKKTKEAVVNAEAYLAKLRQDVEDHDLNNVRLEVINHILKLRGDKGIE